MKHKLRVWTIVLTAFLLCVLALLLRNRPDRHGVRFSKVSTKPPHVIYHRGHYIPVPAGKLLYRIEALLERRGYDPDLVRAQHFSFDDDWCILLGLQGPMNGRYFARIITAQATNQIFMTGAWSTLNDTEHLIFWRLKPIPPEHNPVRIELLDTNSNTILATHRVTRP